MKSIVIYDSLYGNTEQIAQSINGALGTQGETTILRVGDIKMELLAGLDLLIIGSPTQKFKSTDGMKDFLSLLPRNALKGIKVAAFDTRLTQSKIAGTPILPHFVKIFGYAAESIAKALQKKGGELVIPPEGFYVKDTEGPLVEGELERAAAWALKLFA
jgi:flavodoxin